MVALFAHQQRNTTVAWESHDFPATWLDQPFAPPPSLATDEGSCLPENPVSDNPCLVRVGGCSCPNCRRNPRHQFPALFVHGNPYDPDRYIDKGEPLRGTSWLNRPCHTGWFMGGTVTEERVDDRADVNDDFFGGYRFGWDFDHY